MNPLRMVPVPDKNTLSTAHATAFQIGIFGTSCTKVSSSTSCWFVLRYNTVLVI